MRGNSRRRTALPSLRDDAGAGIVLKALQAPDDEEGDLAVVDGTMKEEISILSDLAHALADGSHGRTVLDFESDFSEDALQRLHDFGAIVKVETDLDVMYQLRPAGVRTDLLMIADGAVHDLDYKRNEQLTHDG